MAAPLSLMEALAQVPDPRKRRGRRHPLSAILSLAVLAMLSGAKSYQAISQFGRDKGLALAHALGFRRKKTPSKSTFAGLKQGFELRRERTEKGKTTVEVVHGITSLSRQRATASRLLALTRKHWGIENGSHYRRDVTLGEDASRIRKGSGPEVMAALRNTIIHLAQTVAPSLASAMRLLGNCFHIACDLLGLPQLE